MAKKSYSMRFESRTPGCIFFLIDQSSSMSLPFGNDDSGRSKAQELASCMNRLIENFIRQSAKGEVVKHHFDMGIWKYGSSVASALGGTLEGRDLIPLPELAQNFLRIEERPQLINDGNGGLIENKVKHPVWIDPVIETGTPMCAALKKAHAILDKWIKEHPDSFPPLVVNITDGEATDGNPLEDARSLRELATADGNLLLFNLHLSSQRSNPIAYPNGELTLPDEFARLLFEMSSEIPETLLQWANMPEVSKGARGFLFNADAVSTFRFIHHLVGTLTSPQAVAIQ